jgi:heavy metal sensor kinase
VKASPKPFLGTLVGRLTLAYVALSSLVFLFLIVTLYVLVFYKLDSWSDDYLEFIANEFQHYLNEKGSDEVLAVLQQEAEELDNALVFIRIFNHAGELIGSTDLAPWSGITQQIGLLNHPPTEKIYTTSYDNRRQQSVRVLQLPLTQTLVLQIGVPLADYSRLQMRFFYATLICLILIFSTSALLGRYLARRSVAGINQVTHAAHLVAGGRFQARVPHGNHGAEIDGLVIAFNQMISHINQLMNELREVSDNIAHDLRSPLTRIRSAAEVALRDRQASEHEQQTLGYILQECERLNQLISDILEITAIDAGAQTLMSRQVNIKNLLIEASDLYFSLAEEKEQQWLVKIPTHNIYVQGDQARLQRAVANILDNAVKYTPPAGRISIQLQEEEGGCRISICNSGSHIAATDLPHIFERFYRGDRSRSTIGNGLGLSYAKAIVQAHKGTLEVDTNPSQVCFHLSLPK